MCMDSVSAYADEQFWREEGLRTVDGRLWGTGVDLALGGTGMASVNGVAASESQLVCAYRCMATSTSSDIGEAMVSGNCALGESDIGAVKESDTSALNNRVIGFWNANSPFAGPGSPHDHIALST